MKRKLPVMSNALQSYCYASMSSWQLYFAIHDQYC